ncbi:DUF421 domain-containing protein [Arcanobacterium hippocoleae]|uniref:Uncharacterized membrane protein YcaP (DUF421 family) n=1 Tax=Arcanobacterium hippocoleae TaxID=149017 RepID=A0ABU1T129_9ACTO|nr:YetF domain-containing protein [Arcanobacterium hippocoleae]MDR6939067.1 uncharacterized membrane protein YcaP (DUF421 family) [Arcanobacterium hippocoleae]
MNYPDSFTQWLGLPLAGIFTTILSTVAIYLIFLFAVRIFGQRLLTSLTTFDTLMVLLFGSIVARTALGPVPTLTTGIVAFATLLCLHFLLGRFANTSTGDHFLNRDPIILMAGNKIIEENLRATNTTHRELMSTLREHGISTLDQIAVVIMEPTGKLAVLQNNQQIDPQILKGVKDTDLIPQKYLKAKK